MEKITLWARAGITFNLPKELANKIVNDQDNDTVVKILTNPDYSKYWQFDGETYFPFGSDENENAGIKYDLEFCL